MLLMFKFDAHLKSGKFVDLGNYIVFSLFILKITHNATNCTRVTPWSTPYWQTYRIDNKEIFLQLVFALCYFSKNRKEDKINNIQVY